MDPNACLRAIRDAIEGSDYQTACELFKELDHWLTYVGFPPEDWHRSGTILVIVEELDGEED